MDAVKLTDLELADALNANRKDFAQIIHNIQVLEAELNKRVNKAKEELAA